MNVTSSAAQKRPLNDDKDGGETSKSSKNLKYTSIDDIFQHYTSLVEFCIGGKIKLNNKTSKFFYKTPDSYSCIDFLNLSNEELDTLIDRCTASPFGLGKEYVVNPSVRQAKELRARDFSFQFSPLMNSCVSSQIKKFLGGREFVMEPYKINIYAEGGHFKRHKDTPKNEKMIASLVVCLPVGFEGGVLTVENEKSQSVSFDWGKELLTLEKDTIQWACFFCSSDHFISKVTKGNRVTVTYDIFIDATATDDSVEDKDVIADQYREDCVEKLNNYVEGLHSSIVYGYFPSHVYCFGDAKMECDLRDTLKGNDLLVYDVFHHGGWKVLLQVYYPDIESYGPYVNFHVPDDAQNSVEMEDAIQEEDKQLLNQISTLELLNNKYNCKQEEIYDYTIAYGYTGNSPVVEEKSLYAGTIMVFQHKSTTEPEKKDT